jgi:hypothetical protein
MDKLLAKINKLTNWQVAIIIAVVGFAVFSTGLTNPFMGDDNGQIVDNPVVHSLSNIRLFFEGGTFYNGQGIAPLTGAYYRPLMTTAFSLLFTLFGLHPLYFHLFQLLICIASAFILFLFLRFTFITVLALPLSLVFLLHPINSQVVYALPAMQDALFFFFGILSMWLLLRFNSLRGLLLVAASLFLSMLSKEVGLLFVAMSLLYLYWFDRKRLLPLAGIMSLPIVLYLVLKINAVGLRSPVFNAPVDRLSLLGRMITVPSIIFHYITALIFPLKLASGYYWVYPKLSFQHSWVPLGIDLAVVALFVYLAFVIHKRLSKAQLYSYLFFATWATIGLLAHFQILPLDMTACDNWFYFPMVGVLGMVGVIIIAFQAKISPTWFYVIAALIIIALGVRTSLRGFDWRNVDILADRDIAASDDNFAAYVDVSDILRMQGKIGEANEYAQRAVDIFPSFSSYNQLGLCLEDEGDYAGAFNAFNEGLKYADFVLLYENIGGLTLVYGNPNTGKQFLMQAIGKFPHDATLWMYLAILDDRNNDNADAKVAISNAASNGSVPQFIYDGIMTNRPFELGLAHTGKSITVP